MLKTEVHAAPDGRNVEVDLEVALQGTWVDKRFGEDPAKQLRSGVVLGLKHSNETAGTEYLGSPYRSRPVYGSARYWYGLAAVAAAVSRMTGAPIVHLHGRPYALLDGVLIYPWKYGDSRDLDHRDIPFDEVSQLRADLFAARTERRNRSQGRIDFVRVDGVMQAVYLEGELPEPSDHELKAVLVAYCSNPEAGLLSVVLGFVEAFEDGHLEWIAEEQVVIADALPGDLAATWEKIVTDEIQRFDAAREPDLDLGLRADESGEVAGDDSEDGDNGEGKGFPEAGGANPV